MASNYLHALDDAAAHTGWACFLGTLPRGANLHDVD